MKEQLRSYQAQVEAWLETRFSQSAAYQTLLDAMRYSLLAGGKRLRPVLVLAFCRACGGDPDLALPFAGAVELVHTYSLIHDDLPCMDNDDYRRGKLTCHRVYGEAGAVLAGDGLLTAAFETLTQAALPAETVLQAVRELSQSAGPDGMVGGQQLDLEGEGHSLNVSQLELLQNLKTGAMIRCACRLGVLAAGGNQEQLQAATTYAAALGLAFQIRDDLLDCIGTASLLGKATGSDEKAQKSTFVTCCGMEECQKRIDGLTQKAISALDGHGMAHTDFLKELALELAQRDH